MSLSAREMSVNDRAQTQVNPAATRGQRSNQDSGTVNIRHSDAYIRHERTSWQRIELGDGFGGTWSKEQRTMMMRQLQATMSYSPRQTMCTTH
jgi:hypothetical protein